MMLLRIDMARPEAIPEFCIPTSKAMVRQLFSLSLAARPSQYPEA